MTLTCSLDDIRVDRGETVAAFVQALGITVEQYARLLVLAADAPDFLRAHVARRLDLTVHAVPELMLVLPAAHQAELNRRLDAATRDGWLTLASETLAPMGERAYTDEAGSTNDSDAAGS